MSNPAGRFSFLSRLRRFGHAVDGLMVMMRSQPNAVPHLIATVIVILLAAFLGVEAADWRWLIVALAVVWTAEAFKTAVGHVSDLVSPDGASHARDIAAGAVLICVFAAVVIGAITLWPYLHAYLQVLSGPVHL
ncbi:diacylglycerol kinase [Asticcacaulis biprosthecium C19]|uniref:Diacylglycerol kinase n=1 Tax=Asticcacaulis biprosthecium C19 TaxID=715226 RepID=F4QKW4_9CAUL|nr:diacylglycerol kinase family protein [Asticcacaulis biprosthecium]EGF92187.1 diacylglycerol kinase [Asticcacaulis biprosthecium C19]